MTDRPVFDVVGVGANSVDHVYRLPVHPQPDTPHAKVKITEHVVSFGGQTATTLCTCAKMGLRTRYIGALGTDALAESLRATLERCGVNLEGVVSRDGPNGHAVILIDDSRGERVVLWERDPMLALRDEDIPTDLASTARLVHVDDVDERATIRAAEEGRRAGRPVTSDIERVAPHTQALIDAVTIPIFAEHVVCELTGHSDPERALRDLHQPHHQMSCVTLGARGALLLADDAVHRVDGIRVNTVDTTGAGDVFRGAFIYALLRGDRPPDIVRFANAAAAVSCTRLGAISAVPTIQETEHLLSTY